MRFSLSIAFLLLVSGSVSARGSVFDGFYGRGSSGQAKPEHTGFDLADALGPDDDSGFSIDHALRPGNLELVQTLKKIIENQDDALRLLKQLTAPKSRFYGRS
ncbi:3-chlorobenzoate-34-dioxygenase oxygenase subunit [Dissostichus eleginoides]|uniref:3-chlorobenzoate-34-dioxygenase oxygenase subunit n=1 Tax=Dissostichus eleginoides TaxID=100907 RepID=A0AAD9EWE8_DISEL|nr:3-chlorobenzoate-34-dioxygenase oxygenase subunit [Dissostichus eleginoides]